MSRDARRAIVPLGILALAAALLGSDCEPTDPVITLESMQARVEVQRSALCAAYAERGLVPDLPTFADPDCP